MKKIYKGLVAKKISIADKIYSKPASGCWAISVYTESSEHSDMCTETTNYGGNYGELIINQVELDD